MNKINILILGKYGYLSIEIQKKLITIFNVVTISSENLSDTNLISIIKFNNIDVIINCIAIVGNNKVDSDFKMALEINSLLPKRLSQISFKYKCRLIHFSTNSIFNDNNGKIFYENDKPNPSSNYGITKYGGELSIINNCSDFLIIRLPNLYSCNLINQRNLLTHLYDSIYNLKSINLNVNEFLTPISTKTVAEAIVEFIIERTNGIRHLSEERIVTWKILIDEIINQSKIKNIVINDNAKNNFITSCLGSRFENINYSSNNIISTIKEIKYEHNRN